MQHDAAELDNQRERRLAEIESRDKAAAEQDDSARARNAKYGGRADFVNNIHKSNFNSMSLADRMGRTGVSSRTSEEE